MPPAPARDGQRAYQAPVETLFGYSSKGLVRPLQDALGADVDPTACGHLPVHGEPEPLEAAELVPVGPVGDEVGVGDKHPRGPLVGPEHAYRAPGLDEQGLVVLQRTQGGLDGVKRGPVPRRPSCTAVHDQVVRVLGHLGVEVVVQHAQCRLL